MENESSSTCSRLRGWMQAKYQCFWQVTVSRWSNCMLWVSYYKCQHPYWLKSICDVNKRPDNGRNQRQFIFAWRSGGLEAFYMIALEKMYLALLCIPSLQPRNYSRSNYRTPSVSERERHAPMTCLRQENDILHIAGICRQCGRIMCVYIW